MKITTSPSHEQISADKTHGTMLKIILNRSILKVRAAAVELYIECGTSGLNQMKSVASTRNKICNDAKRCNQVSKKMHVQIGRVFSGVNTVKI